MNRRPYDDVPRNATVDISASGGPGRCQARLDLAGEGPATMQCGGVG